MPSLFRDACMRSTVEDDLWVLNHVREVGVSGVSSYRYRDVDGITHRAVWHGLEWLSCCGEKIVEKLREGDAGAITCVRCLGAGA